MLRQRVLTALPLALGFGAAIVYLPVPWLAGLFGLVVLAGAQEWARLAGLGGGAAWAYALAVLALALALWWQAPAAGPWLIHLGFAWWLGVQAWMLASGLPERSAGASVPWLLCGALTLALCFAGLLGIGARTEQGRPLLLLVMVLVWAADIGAYFAGRRWGRHKLAPRTSPGKTWEGVLGGLVCVLAVALAAAAALGRPPEPVWPLLLAALLAGTFSVTGDLLESRLKRRAGAKDSGQLLPGHGGVLDRIDSLTAAAPVFLWGLSWWDI